MKPKHFKLEIYNVNFYFFIGWVGEDFANYLDEKFDVLTEIDEWDRGATLFSEDHRAVFLWVKKDNDMFPTLVHECVHAACFALDWAGVYVDMKEDEALAYLAELIFAKASPLVMKH